MKTLLALTLFTTLTGAVSAAQLPVLSCSGTEPFWGVKTAAEGTVAYDNYGDKVVTFDKAVLKSAVGRAEGYAFQIEATDTANKTIRLNVIKKECDDGMSDATYAYTALVDVDGGILEGCCN